MTRNVCSVQRLRLPNNKTRDEKRRKTGVMKEFYAYMLYTPNSCYKVHAGDEYQKGAVEWRTEVTREVAI